MVHELTQAALALALASACLTRPIVGETPTTQTVVFGTLAQQKVDKVDLLFAIDNSQSMGDKQQLLALAVPVLVQRLIDPNCVSTAPGQTCKQAADCSSFATGALCDTSANHASGQCYLPGDGGGVDQCKSIPNSQPEFPPVHDMHIGVVTSSLGGGGSPDICNVTEGQPDPQHFDDHGWLINRTLDATTNADGPGIAQANPVSGEGGDFLAWLPASFPENAGKQPPNVTPYGTSQASQMVSDFQSLVNGVQQHGCGLEAQLESWYRFLVQPDPWQSIVTSNDSPPRAQYQGVDATLLQMRHDFLRPDSLVAIIQLTDEEDSWSDPMWLGGYGWLARTNATQDFEGPGLGAMARGTHECDTNPNDPDCVSCAFQGKKPVSQQPVSQDPSCTSCAAGTTGCPKPGWYTPASPGVPIAAADGVNARYSRQIMRRRYGYDNQHDYHRYVDGLQSPTVPDLANESHGGSGGYEADDAHYTPTRDCTNPLFAQNLPDGSDTSHAALCDLQPGPRTPNLVFYAIIGGVPPDLLADSAGNLKLDLGASDWTAILGKDPDHYDFTGIDPRMVQSTAPRCSGASCPQGMSGVPATYSSGFREWNTLTSEAAIDLQYACVFPLPKPKDCTAAANAGSCDCCASGSGASCAPPTDPSASPLCDATVRTQQDYGKAYPQSRYQLVAKALGAQAVVASICAGDTNPMDVNLPSFGYNGAMQAIVNRLRAALGGECLPQPLEVASDGSVPCTVLVEYRSQQQTGSPGSFTDPPTACTDPGMSVPPASVVTRFDASFAAALGDAGASQPPPVVCEYQQLLPATFTGGSCKGQPNAGWCYAVGPSNTGGCAQAIEFGGSGPPASTTVSLECIEQR